MKTFQEALAICEKEKDGFYLSAFMFQAWLGQLLLDAAAQYAEKKDPRDRSMQNGQAWRAFLDLFRRPAVQTPESSNQPPSTSSPPPPALSDSDLPHILSDLLRFAGCDDPMSEWLANAAIPLSIEHDCTGDYIGPKSLATARLPKEAADLARRSIARWCDWLDACIHYRTHQFWHLAPACFDPDPEKRELALLGTIQRHAAGQTESSRARWQSHFSEAAERFKDSPKWSTLGKAMSAQSDRLWPYHDIDAIIISLWPLLKKHNWTYRDLLNVASEIISLSSINHKRSTINYPLDSEQSLATYCTNVLGLRKSAKGVTAKTGKPPGHDIALRFFTKP